MIQIKYQVTYNDYLITGFNNGRVVVVKDGKGIGYDENREFENKNDLLLIGIDKIQEYEKKYLK